MANFSRALLAVGEGLQGMANRQYDRERERVLAMREENLTRLRSDMDDKKLEKQQGFMSAENEKERTARSAETAAERTAREAENAADRKLRMQEGESDRNLRRTEGAADRGIQSERFRRDDAATQDTSYIRQLNAIDERLQRLNEMKLKPALEGNGMAADPAAVAQVDAEIGQLQQQKRQLGQERDISLARNGDKRYKPISPEEAAQFGGTATPHGAAPERPAAQPGTSIKVPQRAAQAPAMNVPQAPPMDPQMASRLQGRGIVSPTAGIQMPGPNPLQMPGSAGLDKEALGRENTINSALQAIQSGKQPGLAELELLRKVPRGELAMKGFDEAMLGQLGL